MLRHNEGMIRHSVVFSLVHDADSAEERDFLATGRAALSAIPGVEHFAVLRQVSPKSEHRFLFEMTFADDAAYQAYNEHPAHLDFVSSRWVPEVSDFQELDYVPLGP